MAILLTGGTAARTSLQIAALCRAANVPYVLASRSSSNPEHVVAKFDWTDPSTYANPFATKLSEPLTACYMIMPRTAEVDRHMNAFIDYAAEQGVKRFVLCGGTTVTLGGYGPGKVWEHLVNKGLEFAICKPTWFMENFTSEWYHLKSIREEGKFYTCTGDAKIPFNSADDIAGVAYGALTASTPVNGELKISGPEALSHDEVAALLTKVAGRPIQHVSVSTDARREAMKTYLGMDEGTAGYMSFLESLAAEGKDDLSVEGNSVKKTSGRDPVSFESFAEKNKQLWQ